MPGRRGEYEVEPVAGRRPGFEGSLGDVHARELGQVAPSGRGQVVADLDAADLEPSTSEGKGGLAGRAAHFQYLAAGRDSGRVDEGVEEFVWVVGPGALVEVGGRIERCPELVPRFRHVRIIAAGLRLGRDVRSMRWELGRRLAVSRGGKVKGASTMELLFPSLSLSACGSRGHEGQGRIDDGVGLPVPSRCRVAVRLRRRSSAHRRWAWFSGPFSSWLPALAVLAFQPFDACLLP